MSVDVQVFKSILILGLLQLLPQTLDKASALVYNSRILDRQIWGLTDHALIVSQASSWNASNNTTRIQASWTPLRYAQKRPSSAQKRHHRPVEGHGKFKFAGSLDGETGKKHFYPYNARTLSAGSRYECSQHLESNLANPCNHEADRKTRCCFRSQNDYARRFHLDDLRTQA